MDEILETMEISREDIPEHVLNQLRNVTLDPLRLIDIDSPYRIDNLSIFFRHSGMAEPDGSIWIANLYRVLYGKNSVERAFTFPKRTFNKKTFWSPGKIRISGFLLSNPVL